MSCSSWRHVSKRAAALVMHSMKCRKICTWYHISDGRAAASAVRIGLVRITLCQAHATARDEKEVYASRCCCWLRVAYDSSEHLC